MSTLLDFQSRPRHMRALSHYDETSPKSPKNLKKKYKITLSHHADMLESND